MQNPRNKFIRATICNYLAAHNKDVQTLAKVFFEKLESMNLGLEEREEIYSDLVIPYSKIVAGQVRKLSSYFTDRPCDDRNEIEQHAIEEIDELLYQTSELKNE